MCKIISRFMRLGVVAIALLILSVPVQAQSPCSAIGAGLGALAGFGIGSISRSTAVTVFATAAGADLGGSGFGEPCEEWAQEFADHYQDNPIDYDEFVENTCGGNPFNCPGTLNPWDFPDDCIFIIDCTAGGMPWSHHTGMSVNNFIQLIDHAYYSQYAGSWLPPPSFGGGCGGGFCDPL